MRRSLGLREVYNLGTPHLLAYTPRKGDIKGAHSGKVLGIKARCGCGSQDVLVQSTEVDAVMVSV